jgi:hypothetical protein
MTETFKAQLQGNPWDLWGLSKIFNGTNADATTIHAKDSATIRLDMRNRDDREHFAHFGHDTHADLTSNSFRLEFPFNNRDMHDLIVPVLSRINAIGALLDPEFWPVTLFRSVYIRPGSISYNSFDAGSKWKDKTGLGEQSQVPFAFDAFELGSDNTAISFVMDALNLPTTWASMYLIYEAIRENVGGPKALEQFGFVTSQELSDFTFAANTSRKLSEGIRHATRHNVPSPSHIPLSEARQIIIRLATAWLEAWRSVQAEESKKDEGRSA